MRQGPHCDMWHCPGAGNVKSGDNQIWILRRPAVDRIGQSVYYPGRNFSSSSGLGRPEQAVIVPRWLLLLVPLTERVAHLWPFCIGRFQLARSILWQFSVCLGENSECFVGKREFSFLRPLLLASEGEGSFWGAGKWQINAASTCWPSYGVACCEAGAQPAARTGSNQRWWWPRSLQPRHGVHRPRCRGERGLSPRAGRETGSPQPWLRLCVDFWLLAPLQGVAKIRQGKATRAKYSPQVKIFFQGNRADRVNR